MKTDDFYKKIFKEHYIKFFGKKPTRHHEICFMWGMGAGEDRNKESEASDNVQLH